VPKPNSLLVGLGRAIRATRDEQRVSQEELGLRSGVHRNYIGGIERAERQPSVVTLARLARALSVKPADLLALAERLSP
jgi:transcriptional regulator with XRE-family HTH domain